MKTKLIFLFSVLSLAVFAFSILPQTVSGDDIGATQVINETLYHIECRKIRVRS